MGSKVLPFDSFGSLLLKSFSNSDSYRFDSRESSQNTGHLQGYLRMSSRQTLNFFSVLTNPLFEQES